MLAELVDVCADNLGKPRGRKRFIACEKHRLDDRLNRRLKSRRQVRRLRLLVARCFGFGLCPDILCRLFIRRFSCRFRVVRLFDYIVLLIGGAGF